jgi:hypothetical protein
VLGKWIICRGDIFGAQCEDILGDLTLAASGDQWLQKWVVDDFVEREGGGPVQHPCREKGGGSRTASMQGKGGGSWAQTVRGKEWGWVDNGDQ